MNRMVKKLLSRTAFYFTVFLLIISFNFVIIRLLPGDPLLNMIGENEYYYLSQKKPEILENMRVEYQLDGNLPQQYIRYLMKTSRMDFGYSYFHAAKVTDVVVRRLGWTLLLTVPSIIIAAVLGAALGLASGWRQGKLEKTLTPLFIFLNSVPSYCLGILALFYLAFTARLFPIGGMASAGTQGFARVMDILWHMVLPVSILVIGKTAYNYLIMKNCVTLVKNEDYILIAKSKGLTEKRILMHHLLRNALLPYMATVFMQFGYAMSGVMTLEVVFSWTGTGKLVADSALAKDYPVLQLSFLLLCICIMATNLLADLLGTWIDPRTKSEDVML
jgi:peptide/nickel transport system permease protein